jgi:ribosome-associated protein
MARRMRAERMRSEDLIGEIERYAADKKAIDVVMLDLRGIVGYTDYFFICSGNTGRQTKAIHDGILEGLKRDHGILPRRVEGASSGEWILIDCLDVVAHIFTPQARDYYRLQELWEEAPVRAPTTVSASGAGSAAADADTVAESA